MAKRPKEGDYRGSGATSPPPAAKRSDGKPYRIALKDHKARASTAWSNRDLWQKFYDDAYEFAIPFRQPSARRGKAQQKIDRLFDATAIESAFRSAGQLHADLFPPDFFKLAPGAVSKLTMEKSALEELKRRLSASSAIVNAFFQTGEFDTSSSEMCIDLLVGTGSLFPVEGDSDNPVRFVCIPFDELAIEVDAYGKVVAIFWKSMLSRRAIKNAFPKGNYPDSFTRGDNKPDEEIQICQDFVFDPERKDWIFTVYLDDSEMPVVEAEYRTQPMAVPRYHRVPGEPYGRGPILLALPTIKTLNKAVELTLKSAAIQMLGIWGYRPGGAFNPDTSRLGPGEFWAMGSTGGVLGADVQRLDTSSGKVDVGQLISQELRLQVRSMLGDDRLPDKGATPVSATEIMARMKRIAQNYMGAWARIVNEVHPVIVRRVIEILYRQKLLPQDIPIDTLLIKVEVLSPITAALKAAAQSRIIDFIQLVIALKGSPLAAELIVKVDDALRLIAEDQMPSELIRPVDEQKQLEGLMQQAVAQFVAAQSKGQQPQPGAAA